MADQTITQLTNYTTPLDADVIPIVDVANNTTKKLPISAIFPSSSTDNAIARFDSTTGKLLQNGPLTYSDIATDGGLFGADRVAISPVPNADGLLFRLRGGEKTAVVGGYAYLHLFGNSTNNFGQALLHGGDGLTTEAGGAAISQGGAGGATGGRGGDVNHIGGSAQGGDSGGGNLNFYPGLGNGAGSPGTYGLYPYVGATYCGILDLSLIASSNKLFAFPNQNGVFSTMTSASGAPSSTPAALGQIYINTDGSKKVYISTGTSSSSDWTIIN